MFAHRLEMSGVVQVHAELVGGGAFGDREGGQRAEALVMEAEKMETRPML